MSIKLTDVARFYIGESQQNKALDYLKKNLSAETLSEFAKKFRNNDDDSDIDLKNVCKYDDFENCPWQDDALDFLQTKIPAPVLKEFETEWRKNPSNPILITREQLTYIWGRKLITNKIINDPNKVINDLNHCLNTFHINTPCRIRHFISQISHESCGGRYVMELSSGNQYEGRRDLGNIYPGDGPKFKGAGYIQLTGRNNYKLLANYLNDPVIVKKGCPYVARTYPATSAGYWWHRNVMNKLCDRDASVERITRRVNGGLNGLDSRIHYYNKCCQVIT